VTKIRSSKKGHTD